MADLPYFSDEPTTQEEQAALAAALRKQQALGLIGQLTGDKAMGGVGASLVSGAQHGQQLLAQTKDRSLARQLEAKKDTETRAYQQQQLGMEGRRIGLEAQRVGQEAWTPLQTTQGLFEINHKTGETRPVLGPDQKPLMPPKSEQTSVRRDALIDRMSARAVKDFDPLQWGEEGKTLVTQRDRADAVLGLVKNKQGVLQNLDQRQMEELAEGLQRILSGGAGSEGRVKSLVPPRNWAAGVAGIREWLLNEPQGLNQQEFVKRMADTMERERGIAQGKIDQSIKQRTGSYRTLKKLDPEGWQQVMISGGLHPEHFDENGLYSPPAAAQEGAPHAAASGNHQAALQWAQQRLQEDPNDPVARQVLSKAQGALGVAVAR